jgi:hypothetical protein
LGGGKLQLSWPAWADGCTLHAATNLATPIQWRLLATPPESNISGFRLRLPTTNAPQQFYRLSPP